MKQQAMYKLKQPDLEKNSFESFFRQIAYCSFDMIAIWRKIKVFEFWRNSIQLQD